jgi:YD repeat-containing protein
MPRLWLVAISGFTIVLVVLPLAATPAPAESQRALNAPQSPPLDSFDRPNESPIGSSNGWWGQADTQAWPIPARLVNNQFAPGPGANTTSVAYWVAQMFSGNMEVWASARNVADESEGWRIGMLKDVGESSKADGYLLFINNAVGTGGQGFWEVRKYTDGQLVGQLRPPQQNLGLPTNQVVLLRRVGDSLQAWQSPDGANWTLKMTVTDTTYTTDLHPALAIDSDDGTGPQWDDVGGGQLGPNLAGQSIGVCDGEGTHAQTSSACQHDPVNSLTGAFITRVTDLRLPGIGVPFSWRRSYDSSDATVGRLGPGWTDSYATSLLVQGNGDVLLHGDEGQQVYYTRQGDGSFVGAPGSRSLLSSVAGGYQLVRKDQVVYAFDGSGRLLSMKDRNSQGVTLSYSGSELQTITDSVGRQVGVTHESGLLKRVTLPDGRYVEYGYLDGRLSSVRDARGFTTTYTYDANGRLKTIVDQNTHTVVDNTYGPDGRVTQQVNARGKTGTFSWDAQAKTATYRDARGKEWRDVCAGSVLFERRDPLGNKTRLQWDGDLNIRKVTDARGNATAMTYDARGNLLTRTAPPPLSYDELWTYNAHNDPLTYRDRRANTTDFGYDGAGNLTSVMRPDADGPGPLGRPQTLYGRDPAGTGLPRR